MLDFIKNMNFYFGVFLRYLKYLFTLNFSAIEINFYYNNVLYFNNSYCKVYIDFKNVLYYKLNGVKFYTTKSFLLEKNKEVLYNLEVFGIKNIIIKSIVFTDSDEVHALHILNAKSKFSEIKFSLKNITINNQIITDNTRVYKPQLIKIIPSELKLINQNIIIQSSSINIESSTFKKEQFL